eukprot:scaffold2709_cov163-Ochromonas_danica.AAC.8
MPNLSKVREISWRVAEPEVKYDPILASRRLFKQPARWLLRNAQIFVPLALFATKVILDIVLKREEELRSQRAEELLKIISSQSPALIKAGQALSSRSDLLPKEYLEALQKLQDRCPAFPNDQAFALFREELGYDFEEVFELAHPEPIAAASIGQARRFARVYKARLRTNGASVAIKIQRPKCEDSIAMDMFILRWYAARLQTVLLALKRDIDLVSVVDDFGELLYREIDYNAEAVNAQRFAELYANIQDVFVPKVYTSYSTSKVLVMEWVDGCRLTDAKSLANQNLDPARLVDILVQCSLRQMLENGFFHADPHAGNLLAMKDGKLCYLDFGMVSYVEASQRYSIIEAVVHLVNRDFRALTELYRRMGFIPKDEDTGPIILALETALPDVLNSPVSDFNFKNVISKLGDVMYKFPFSLPPFYIAIIRCLGVLEGLALQIDSHFRIVHQAYPYIASRLLTDTSSELRSALQQLLFPQGAIHLDRLEDLLDQASSVEDYQVALAVDQLIAYLTSSAARPLRETLVRQLIENVDQLETETSAFLSQHREEWLKALVNQLRLWTSGVMLQSPHSLEEAYGNVLNYLLTQVPPGAALHNVGRLMKIVRQSRGMNTTTMTQIARKILREPVLQEMIGQIVAELSERLSTKMVRRVLRGDSFSSTSSIDTRSTTKMMR